MLLRSCRSCLGRMAQRQLGTRGRAQGTVRLCTALQSTAQNASAHCRAQPSPAAHRSHSLAFALPPCPRRHALAPHRQQQQRQRGISTAAHRSHTSPAPPPSHAVSILKLVGVACLWGTYAPLVRLLFLQDAAPAASVLTAAQSCLGTSLLLASNVASRWLNPDSSRREPASPDAAPTRAPSTAVAHAQHHQQEQDQYQQQQQQQPQQYRPALWLAGGEQGLWLFMGAACHTVGLTLASTTSSSFLLQSSAILTPALATLTGDIVPAPVWLASTLGFFGSLLIAYQAAAATPAAPAVLDTVAASGWLASVPAELAGLGFTLVACISYAASTVRLGVHCRQHSPLQLSAATSATYALLSLLWVAWDCWNTSGAVLAATSQLSWQVWAVIGWLALGPGALASFLQTDGQRGVDPSTAQVVYLGTPLWSSLIAATTMQGEGMEALGWAGGALILVGSCIAAAAPPAAVKDEARTLGQ